MSGGALEVAMPGAALALSRRVHPQERIHGLTLAYYYMKRKQPPVAPAPLLDHVNRYSLPGAPALKAIGDGDVAS